jgi:parallel beta-helix repeat protein
MLQNIVVQGGIVTDGTCTAIGGVPPTLQDIYDNSSSPASISLTDAKDFVINAADTTTDPNILFNLQCTTSCGSNGRFAIQSAGTDVLTVNPNGNITVGTGKSLRLTGGNTASRPSSPTEGTLYYDTTTHTLLIWNGSKWMSDKSTATKVVAMGTATGCTGTTPVASGNPAGADYVVTSCTIAQTTINTAITALPSGGGVVYLVEGTYIVDGSITLNSNVTLIGSGPSTIIKFKDSTTSGTNMITATSKNNVGLQNLKLDGNKANNAGLNQSGVFLTSVGSGTGTSAVAGMTANNVNVVNFSKYGLNIGSGANHKFSNMTIGQNSDSGIIDSASPYTTFNNLTIQGNGTNGIEAYRSDLTITGNLIEGNSGSGMLLNSTGNSAISSNTVVNNAGHGIWVTGNNNTITGNTVQGNTVQGIKVGGDTTTVTGNMVASNGNIGIDVASDYNNVASNTVTSNGADGVYVESNSNYNNISGNTITSNASSGVEIWNSSINNQVTGNLLRDNGGTGSSSSIRISLSSNNTTITNNTITDTAGTGFAVLIASGITGTVLGGNTYSGTGASSISDLGTGTVYNGQTDASGNYAIQPAGTINLIANTNVTGNLSVSGTVNSTLGYKFNGTAGSTTTCTSGNVLTNAVIQGGIITGGTCATNGGGVTLQNVYDNSASPATILLANAKDFVINAADTATDPNILFNLQCTTSCGTNGRFAVQQAGSDIFSVSPNGNIVIGTATNNVTFSSSGYEPILNGNAQHSKTLRVSAEYAGAVLDATGDATCSSSINGSMTSGYASSGTSGLPENYYNWNVASTVSTNQCYDVVVQVPVPSDWSGWTGTPTIDAWGDDNTGKVSGTVDVIGGNGTQEGTQFGTNISITTTSSWSAYNLPSLTNNKYTAGSTYVTIRIRMNATSGKNFRIGTISIPYKSKF